MIGIRTSFTVESVIFIFLKTCGIEKALDLMSENLHLDFSSASSTYEA